MATIACGINAKHDPMFDGFNMTTEKCIFLHNVFHSESMILNDIEVMMWWFVQM